MIATIRAQRRTPFPVRFVLQSGDAVTNGRFGRQWNTGFTPLIERVRILASADELPTGLDLIIEAVPERLELKRGVLAAAEARQPAILASNTSGLSIGDAAV